MPKLTDSYSEINKYIAALSGSGLGNAQAFAQMAGGWDGKSTRQKADDLGAWILQNYKTPDNILELSSKRSNYSQPADELEGDDWVSKRGGMMASQRNWKDSEDYANLTSAQNAYNKTQAGKENAAYNALFKALDREAVQENNRQLSGGWLENRADDATDFLGKYGTPLTMALMSMGMGGAAAGAMQAAGYGGAAAGAVGGATSGALGSAFQGGSVGKGALTGGLLGGLGGAMSGTNAAQSLGIENKTGQGFLNGAIKGGATAAIRGGDIGTGLVGGAIGGGVQAFNPSASLGLDNKYGQGLANGAIAGLLQGKDFGAVLGSAAQGAAFGALSGKFDGPSTAPNNLLPTSAGDGGGDEGIDQEGGSGMGEDDDILKWLYETFGDGNVTGSDDSGFVFDPKLLEDTLNSVNQSNAAWLEENPWWQSLSGDDKSLWENIQAGGFPSVAGQDSNFLSKIGNFLGGSSGIGSNGNMGGALAALLGTGLGAASGGGSNTATSQSKTDPRMDPYIYGDQGYLQALQSKYNANPSGINPTMQQGLEIGKANLTDPAYAQTYQNMRNVGNGLLSQPIAGNPFTNGQGGQVPPTGLLTNFNDRAQNLMVKGVGLLAR